MISLNIQDTVKLAMADRAECPHSSHCALLPDNLSIDFCVCDHNFLSYQCLIADVSHVTQLCLRRVSRKKLGASGTTFSQIKQK